MRIVIVEDELRIREGLAGLIRKIDGEYEIVGEAEDGLAGIRVIAESRPDLVITDVRMPDLDGLEMLSRLEKSGVKVKAIVLSAYSDFAYACQAIKLGVGDYLLKPVNVGDLTRALRTMEDRIAAEKRPRRREGGLTLEGALYSVMIGSEAVDEGLASSLMKEFRVDADGPFALATVYLGTKYESDGKKVLALAEAALAKAAGFRYAILELPKSRALAIVAFDIEDSPRTREWFEGPFMLRIRASGSIDLCVGWASFRGLAGLRDAAQRVDACLDWNLALGGLSMLAWPDVEKTPVSPLAYPIEIEGRARSALCALDLAGYRAGIAEFMDYLRRDAVYSPKDIKNSFVRFFWSLLNIAREVEYERYAEIPQQEILERISFAVSRSELESAGDALLRLFPQEVAAAGDEDAIDLARRIGSIRSAAACC